MMEERDWENFKNLVMKASATQQRPNLTPARERYIERRLRELFPTIRNIPDNPTYASMILKAITDLNEEMGSSVDAISSFMKTEYKSLPWAHSTILKYHLKNLCESGEIVITDEMHFMLPKDPAETNLTLDQSREQQNGKKVISPKKIEVENINKMKNDWGIGVVQVEDEHQRPKIILKFKRPNSDTNDGFHGFEEPLGRGHRNKGKRSNSLFNLTHKLVESTTPRKRRSRSRRPTRFQNPTPKNEPLQLGSERKHAPLFFLPHGSKEDMPSDKRMPLETCRKDDIDMPSDKRMPLETCRISLPATRPNMRPPKCKSVNDGEPPKFSAAIPEGISLPATRPKMRPPKCKSVNDGEPPKFSSAIPEGIIIALPAQPKKQVKLMRQISKAR